MPETACCLRSIQSVSFSIVCFKADIDAHVKDRLSGGCSRVRLPGYALNVKPAVVYVLAAGAKYNAYTLPCCAAAVSGTVEERSIVEPVRNLIHGKVGSIFAALDISFDAYAGLYFKAACAMPTAT